MDNAQNTGRYCVARARVVSPRRARVGTYLNLIFPIGSTFHHRMQKFAKTQLYEIDREQGISCLTDSLSIRNGTPRSGVDTNLMYFSLWKSLKAHISQFRHLGTAFESREETCPARQREKAIQTLCPPRAEILDPTMPP
jgi:hypothetical protein